METTKYTAIYALSGTPYVGQHAYNTLTGLHQAISSVKDVEPHDVFTGTIKVQDEQLDWGTFSIIARHRLGIGERIALQELPLSEDDADDDDQLDLGLEDEDEDEEEQEDSDEDEEVSLERDQFLRCRSAIFVHLIDLSQVELFRHTSRPEGRHQVMIGLSSGETLCMPIDMDVLHEILDAWMVCRGRDL